MAFKVTLKTPTGDQVIECADDTYILDAAEEAGKYKARITIDLCVVAEVQLARNRTATI